MTDRFDALCVRESNGKSYFTKIGAAFPNRDGKGYTILLDAVPASNEGQYKIMLREPLPRDGAARDQQHRERLGSGPRTELDDDIPPF